MPHAGPVVDPSRVSARTPLWSVLVLTWLCSLTSGTVVNGVYFVAKSAYGFGAVDNLLLGLALGAAYIPGALLIGPALRRLARRVPWLTTRDVLLAMVVVMGAVGAVPVLMRGSAWVIWPVVAVLSAMYGAQWPIVESYLSGGRRGDTLRRAVGSFNICWASAIVAASLLMAPLIEKHPLEILLITGVVQAGSAIFLRWFAPYPARHVEESHPHPPVYERLLAVFRWLLPASYVLLYCLAPMLPDITAGLGVHLSWATLLAGTWALSRVGAFTLFSYWGGWHGRWRTPIWTTAALLVGFGLCVTASTVPALIGGLALFGVGLGGIYSAALYYAMEVGAAEVDAGGVHEALIGVGYSVGPLLGLSGIGVARAFSGESVTSQGATLALACALVGLAVVVAWRAARRVDA